MRYLALGRTGLQVSRIGIGTEHMHGRPRETVIGTIREAIERGVSYFDVIFAMPEYLETMCLPLQGMQDRVHLTAHLASTNKDGLSKNTWNVMRRGASFHAQLSRLDRVHTGPSPYRVFDIVYDGELHSYQYLGGKQKETLVRHLSNLASSSW
jgi:predicted aldo/keto reductase-like oxidoreductase